MVVCVCVTVWVFDGGWGGPFSSRSGRFPKCLSSDCAPLPVSLGSPGVLLLSATFIPLLSFFNSVGLRIPTKETQSRGLPRLDKQTENEFHMNAY